MIEHCYEYASAASDEDRPIVGIMCEYTPRELIMAAGGVPVCLCGGSAETIPDAEEDLPANLCPLVKSTYGYCVQESNPFLGMADLVVAETTCDGKKKMFELMARRHDMFVLELPQKPGDPDAFEHWVSQIRWLKSALEKRFGTRITDKRLRHAIGVMNEERRLRRQLAGLMKSANPPFTGRQLLDFKSIISGRPEDFEQYRRAYALFKKHEPDPKLNNRVRVLLTGVPVVHGAERVIDLIEKHGGLVVCQENCTGIKPILQDVAASAADPIRALAEKYFAIPCSVMTRNDGRLRSLKKLIREFRPHCVIDLAWHACLTYDVESHFVRRLARTFRLPYLKIVTDYSPSDSARIAVRVEALFETARGRRRR